MPFFHTAAYADKGTPKSVRLAQTASGRSAEYVTDLSEDWKFEGGETVRGSGEL